MNVLELGEFSQLNRKDVWLNIFILLDTKQLFTVIPKICRGFRNLFSIHRNNYKNLKLNVTVNLPKILHHDEYTIEEGCLGLFTYYPVGILYLDKLDIKFELDSLIDFNYLPCIQTLKSLKLTATKNIIKKALTLNFPNLEKLKIIFLDKISSEFLEDLIIFLSSHKIKQLSVNCNFISGDMLAMYLLDYTHLIKLDLSILLEEPFFYIFKGYNLKKVKLYLQVKYDFFKTIKIFLNNCFNLEKLTICVGRDSAINQLQGLVHSNLKYLTIKSIDNSLSYCRSPDFKIVLFPNLEHLKMAFKYRVSISASDVFYLIKNNLKLIKINIIPDIIINNNENGDDLRYYNAVNILNDLPSAELIEYLRLNKRCINYNGIQIGYYNKINELELTSLKATNFSDLLGIQQFKTINQLFLKDSQNIENIDDINNVKIIIKSRLKCANSITLGSILNQISKNPAYINEISSILFLFFTNIYCPAYETINIDVKSLSSINVLCALLNKQSVKTLVVNNYLKKLKGRSRGICETYFDSVRELKYYAKNNNFSLLSSLVKCVKCLQSLEIYGIDPVNNYFDLKTIDYFISGLSKEIESIKIMNVLLGKNALWSIGSFLRWNHTIKRVELKYSCQSCYRFDFKQNLIELNEEKHYEIFIHQGEDLRKSK